MGARYPLNDLSFCMFRSKKQLRVVLSCNFIQYIDEFQVKLSNFNV